MSIAVCLGLSKQKMEMDELASVASNLSQLDRKGFKAEYPLFEKYLVPDGKGGSAPFMVSKGVWRDMQEGNFEPTGRPYDLAIKGKAFFQVETPEGPRYTKDGSFTLSPDGIIVNAQGFAVLDEGGAEITVPPTAREVIVNTDGTLLIDGDVTAKIGLYEFNEKDLNKLALTKFGLYFSPTQPTLSIDSAVAQGSLESSNVDGIKEVVRMIELSRGFEILQTAIEKDHELTLSAIRKIAGK